MVRFAQIVGIVLLFFILGPPVGAVVFAVLGSAGAWLTGQPSTTAQLFVNIGLLGLVFSWFVGGLQAAIAGLAMAVFFALKGRLSALVAIAGGLLAGLPYIHGEAAPPLFGVLLALVHVVAAWVCAMIVKAIARWTPRPAARPV